MSEFEDRILALETLHDNFRIVAGSNVTVEGDIRKGHAICSTCPPEGVSAEEGPPIGGGGGGTPTGACCMPDGSCRVESSAQCSTDGGTYQGNGTPCSPNPCLVTGACCVSGSCSVQTLADCNSAGGHYLGDYSTCLGVDCVHGACCHGSTCTITTPAECLYTYMGDGTTCDPNPCYIVSECCAGGFLVGGIRYLSKTVCVIGNASYDWCAGAPCDGNCNFCSTVDIDPVTCAHTTSCDGSSFVEADGFAESLTWLLRSNGHCGWSESNFSSTGNVGLCGECDPGCPIESGYLEDFTTPCSNLCTDSNIGGEPCPPVGCCGTRGFQVTIDYSNPCSSP